jgi:hypothetical protein
MPTKGRIACRRRANGKESLLFIVCWTMTLVPMALSMSGEQSGVMGFRQFLCRSSSPLRGRWLRPQSNRLVICRPTILSLCPLGITTIKTTGLCFSSSVNGYVDIGNKTKDSDLSSSHLIVPVSDTRDLPFRKFGYRSVPFTWKELEKIVVDETNLSRLSRSVETERRYKTDRERWLKEYESIYDHILYTKFHFPRLMDESTGKWKVDALTESKEKSNLPTSAPPHRISKVSLLKNEYPYFVEAGIEHWVLWKLHSSVTQEDVIQAMANLKAQYNDGEVIGSIWWENPHSLKSLPDISHIHILLRRKSNLQNSKCPSVENNNCPSEET